MKYSHQANEKNIYSYYKVQNEHPQGCSFYFIQSVIFIEKTKNLWYNQIMKGGIDMEKYAWKAKIVDGAIDEYIRRHDALWDEMKEVLERAGIVNYTIWNVGNELFGYYECEKGVEYAAIRKAAAPIIGGII